MDLDKIFIKNAKPTKIGGQAVMEGIMMKGHDRTAVVIRKPGNKLHIKISPLAKPSKWRNVPILRGILVFGEALVTGTKTLLYSAEVLEEVMEDEWEPDKLSIWMEKKFGKKTAFNIMLYLSVVLAVLFTVGVFIILPTGLTNIFGLVTQNKIALNLFEGLLRIVMFVAYILAISRLKDIRTVFQFHGAEHSCIHCYENDLELTVENCSQFGTIHPRCGTSFLMFVMVISLLMFSLLGWPNLLIRIASRLLLIPLIAGISYELLRLAGKGDSGFIKVISMPGLALQKITTVKPDESQLVVAIAALKAVLNTDGPLEFEGLTDIDGNLFTEETEEVSPESKEEGQ